MKSIYVIMVLLILGCADKKERVLNEFKPSKERKDCYEYLQVIGEHGLILELGDTIGIMIGNCEDVQTVFWINKYKPKAKPEIY